MGRPLNSKHFGNGPGALRITFNDGESVVNGYIVKQTGTRRYQVTTDGVTIHEVDLATTTDEAANLGAGQATIKAVGSDGKVAYITSLQAAVFTATDGSTVSWTSEDPEAPKIVPVDAVDEPEVPVEEPPYSPEDLEDITVATRNLSAEAVFDAAKNTMFMGTTNPAHGFRAFLNKAEGVEIGIRIHKRSAGAIVPSSLDGDVLVYTIPANGLTTTNSITRTDWVIDYSVVAGIGGKTSVLNDYDFSMSVDLDPLGNGATVDMVRNSASSWFVGETEIMAIDGSVVTRGDVTKVDQNTTNLGYASWDASRPNVAADWASTDGGMFNLVLTATKKSNGRQVAQVKVRVVTSTTATW